MKIGLRLSAVRPEDYVSFATRADELGYDCLLVSDHLACPPVLPIGYPYSESGEPPFVPDAPWPDPLMMLTYVSAVTRRIKLATSVYILPLRHPVHTAKLTATLDVLSRGRFIFGIGGGWMRQEFDAAGQEFDHRGTRSLEIIEILRKLWTQKVTEHKGRFYSIEPITCEPKPVQKPHPPLHFGGETDVMLRRAARFGDGWLSMQHTPDTAKKQIQKLRTLREEYGREKQPFEITVQTTLPPTVDTFRRFQELGVDRIRGAFWDTRPNATIKDIHASMERFANDVMSKVRD